MTRLLVKQFTALYTTPTPQKKRGATHGLRSALGKGYPTLHFTSCSLVRAGIKLGLRSIEHSLTYPHHHLIGCSYQPHQRPTQVPPAIHATHTGPGIQGPPGQRFHSDEAAMLERGPDLALRTISRLTSITRDRSCTLADTA